MLAVGRHERSPLPHLDLDCAVWLQVDGTARQFEVEGIDLVVAPDMANSVGVQVSVRENADHIATDITAELITWIGRPKSSRQQQGW